jgi:hypothetical protein
MIRLCVPAVLPLAAFAAALLFGCATPPTPPPVRSTGAATIGPTTGELAGGINLSLLHLDPHDASPGLCDATAYGSIAAASGVGLCVCQPQEDGQRGDWMQVISRQRCWPDSQ